MNGKEKIGPYDKYCTEVSVPTFLPTSEELALKVNLKTTNIYFVLVPEPDNSSVAT